MSRFQSPFWEALGVFGGMIIGSGMFALPYAVSISGLWPSILGAALAFFAVLSIHLAYGEIVANTAESHRLPGYASIYLGKLVGNLTKTTQLVSFNVILLIYGVLGGVFLSTIFKALPPFWWTIIFFGFGSLIFLKNSIAKIGFINFILTLPLILAILIISALSLAGGSIANITFQASDPFFAFGVFVFSLTGLSVIADARDIFGKGGEVHKLKGVILWGTFVPLILYIIFVVAVLAISGSGVTIEAIAGLQNVLGDKITILGAIIGFLAMFTSYLVLGYDLKEIYELDMGMPRFTSWILSAGIPASIFILGFANFVKLISIAGGILIALDSFWVIFILRKMRSLGGQKLQFLSFGTLHQISLIIIFTLSIVYELVYHVF